MRAVQYEGHGQAATLSEVPDPVPPVGGVVVQVRATGVCRSDWHAWMGHDPVPSFPHVPGHEYTGVVAEVGPGVVGWDVGDRVVVPFALGCGECEVCASGNTQVCLRQQQPGFTSWGSFAERVAVPFADANLVALPEDVGFVEAAALGCRLATAHRAVAARGRLAPGEWLAVHGCGGVGLSAVMVGVARGARVVAVDVSESALEAALGLGAEAAVVGGDGAGERVAAVTGGGAHVSVDAIGGQAAMRESVLSLRPLGRHVQVGLMLGPDEQCPAPMGLLLSRELELLGSHGMPSAAYPELLALVASGAIDPSRLVGRVIGLDQAGAALGAMSQAPLGAGMTVVDLELPR